MYSVITIAGLAQAQAPLTGSRRMPLSMELEAHNPVGSMGLTNSVLLLTLTLLNTEQVSFMAH